MKNIKLAAQLMLLVGVSNGALADVDKVQGISLEPATMSIAVGQEKYVATLISPTSAEDKSVTFKSSDPTIVAISQNGEIKAKSAGDATIQATTTDGNFTANLAVTVKDRLALDENKTINLADWDLEWADDFDYPDEQLDEKWVSQNGPTENPYVLCSRWRDNAKVHDGILELKAIKESRGGQDWTCGNIWTKRTFKYGYFEAKYKYAGAKGTNNSFWLWPKTKGVKEGEKAFEIDINEGHYPNEINTNIHNWTDVTTLQNGKVNHFKDHIIDTADGDFSEEYHTYGYAWDENRHEFYFDGKLIRVEENDFNHSETNILLSLAILSAEIAGTVSDDIDGTSMKFDYVRYYKKKPNVK
ncbi:family 16 glycosylhydrolase [Paraglaciecola sp. L3A3]|uniref:family 16 glycosylhydrolase n=1 Tax=Paraglaciecola sp. L3A3 TaxID=2686358 RepID=UPI001E62AB3A|nr:family 16 glycosylhydrolase [Paraglaciecola sp. L3A3]